MTFQTTKPHPTPGVWRTRVWQSKDHGKWAYRAHLSTGGHLDGRGFGTEADARRALARAYHAWFGVPCPSLLARAADDWPTTGRRHRPKEQQA